MFMASNNKSIALIRSPMNCDCLSAIVDQHGLLPTIGHNKPEEKKMKLFWVRDRFNIQWVRRGCKTRGITGVWNLVLCCGF